MKKTKDEVKKERNYALEEVRKSLLLTQEAMADLCGIERSLYGKMERETVKLSYAVIHTLVNLNINIDYVLLKERRCEGLKIEKTTLEKCINWCKTSEEKRKLIATMISDFRFFWKYDANNLNERCFFQQLQATKSMIYYEASPKNRLQYLRETLKWTKKNMEREFLIGYGTREQFEKGRGMDGDFLVMLYQKNLCFPSYFYEQYPCINKIEYMLSLDSDLEQKYYEQLLSKIRYSNNFKAICYLEKKMRGEEWQDEEEENNLEKLILKKKMEEKERF